MEPLVVTARLAGPYVDGGYPIHLDGLLALAWTRRHARTLRLTLASRQTPVEELARAHLPLASVTLDGVEVWLASAALADEPSAPAAVWQTKRRSPEDWDYLDRPVNVTAGPAKDHMLRRAGTVTSSVRWLAWGHRREIVRSLRLLWGREEEPHGQVGSARRSGSGQILSWSVEAEDHAPEECLLRQGRLMRHVPIRWLTAVESPTLGACQPPYWHPARQVDTATVHTEAQLHQRVLDALAPLHAR